MLGVWGTICRGILQSTEFVLNLVLLNDFAPKLYWHNSDVLFSLGNSFHPSGEIKLQLDCYCEKNYAVKSNGSMRRQYYCLDRHWKLSGCKRAAQQ